MCSTYKSKLYLGYANLGQEYMGGMEYEGSLFTRPDIELKIICQHSLRPSHP